MMTLEARQLSFRYGKGERLILDQVCLQLKSGERLGLTASSGRGKTTLCKLLSGYEKPERGAVTLDGKPLSAYGRHCPVQLLWQHPETAMDPYVKIRRSLAESGMPGDDVLDALCIQKAWLDRYPMELSGGELQRICIARALGPETGFLLCDEITAMLDTVTQARIWSFLMEESRRRNLGLLVVSHQRPLLDRVCADVLEM